MKETQDGADDDFDGAPSTRPIRVNIRPLRAAADSFQDFQRARIGAGNRLWQIKAAKAVGLSGTTDPKTEKFYTPKAIAELVDLKLAEVTNVLERFEEDRKKDPTLPAAEPILNVQPMYALGHEALLRDLFETMKHEEEKFAPKMGNLAITEPAYAWVHGQRGLGGPVLAALLLATFDPGRARHASSYWKFAGMAPGSDRLKKGEKAPFSKGARVLCWKVGLSFIRSKHPKYEPIYRMAKERYLARPDIMFGKDGKKLGPGHADMMAKRYMIKQFLVDFWIAGRTARGLSINEPYAVWKDTTDPGWQERQQNVAATEQSGSKAVS